MKPRTTSCIMGVALSVVLTLVFSTAALSRTIYVDDDAYWYGSGTSTDPYRRIGTAIRVARNGDVVLVRPGTYRERITLKEGVRVRRSSAKGVPVIDGRHLGTVVTAIGVGSNTEFRGFKIINGNSQLGSGMYIENSSLKVSSCIFELNQFTATLVTEETVHRGGGIYMTNASPTIEYCTFKNNAARYGGGTSMMEGSNPYIYGCTFESNGAVEQISYVGTTDHGFAHSKGGAMDICSGSNPVVTACNFLENYAVEGDGGAISIGASSTVTLERCFFDGNHTTGGSGGAIYCSAIHERDWPKVYISNSTFWRNQSAHVAGIYAYGPSFVRALHCTFYGNASSPFNGGSALKTSGTGSYIFALNSIIWGNTTPQTSVENGGRLYVYDSDVEGGHSGIGNIDEDPMFVDETSGNFHLRWNSPCIDKGYRYGSILPDYDIDWDDRVIDGDNDGESLPDMGVDEYKPQSKPGSLGSIYGF